MANTETKTRIKPNLSLKEPPLFRVVYMNDDVTSMGFVVETLIDYFHYTEETAAGITTNIHNSGSAIVAVMSYECAEQIGIEVTIAARAQGFPLLIRIEPDVTSD